MGKILLSSAEYVKSQTSLNDNTYDKMLKPALERGQDLDLTECLGECMVQSLQTKVADGTISTPENTLYKELLDNYIQPFLAYTTMSNVVIEIGAVMGNGGVDTITDDHRTTLNLADRNLVKDYWLRFADSYKRKMQEFCKKNKESFPELKGCGWCWESAHLNSSASTSIWLGGARGKRIIR